MTDSAKHLKEATAAILEVKTEHQLGVWEDQWMSTLDYLHLSDEDARELERLYQKRAGRFMGVLAG